MQLNEGSWLIKVTFQFTKSEVCSPLTIFVVTHAIICISDLWLYVIYNKVHKVETIKKFKKFELHNYEASAI